MPGTVCVRVEQARNLPIMDRANETTDAFVELHFAASVYKTDVCHGSLAPEWHSDWFRFEAEEQELQDECLILRVMDHDTYSANDPIGRVYIDVNPLIDAAYTRRSQTTDRLDLKGDNLCEDVSPAVADCASVAGLDTQSQNTHVARLRGWLPIIDTMHGHRGDILVEVKLELLDDANQMRQSSCGVFFCVGCTPPTGYSMVSMHGLVDAVLCSGDPEHQWIDKIRTPRATNDTRQTLIKHLANELRRRIGVKLMHMGANAVLGYHVKYDLEGECTGLVCVRAIGTAVTLHSTLVANMSAGTLYRRSDTVNIGNNPSEVVLPCNNAQRSRSRSESHEDDRGLSLQMAPSTVSKSGYAAASVDSRKPSMSQSYASTQRARYATISQVPSVIEHSHIAANVQLGVEQTPGTALDMLRSPAGLVSDMPLFTVDALPVQCVQAHGGVVCARAVRLLTDVVQDKENTSKKQSYQDAAEARSVWWRELRSELLAHMRALSCNMVMGYTECITLDEEVCIMSAMGTAVLAVVDPPLLLHSHSLTHPGDNKGMGVESVVSDCTLCHLPFTAAALPFTTNLSTCAHCRDGKVCDFVLSTLSLEHFGSVVHESKAQPVQAHVLRALHNTDNGTDEAAEISQMLPYLEHQVHNKLIGDCLSCVQGANGLLSLRITFTITQHSVIALITALAVTLNSLPKSRSESKLPPIMSSESLEWDDRSVQCKVLDATNINTTTLSTTTTTTSTVVTKKGSASGTGISGLAHVNAELAQQKMSTFWSNTNAAIRKTVSKPDVQTHGTGMVPTLNGAGGTTNGGTNTNTHTATNDKLPMVAQMRLHCWTSVPSVQAGALTNESTAPYTNHSLDQSTTSVTSKRSKSRLNKIKFRRRRFVDREDFDSALFVRDLALDVGFIALNMNDVNSCGVSLSVVPVPVSPSATSPTLGPDQACTSTSSSKPEPSASSPSPIVISERSARDLGVRAEFVASYDSAVIRETSTLRHIQDIDHFLQLVFAEMLLSAECEMRALGANSLLCCRLTVSELLGSAAKSQAQCLIGITGDLCTII